MLSPDGASAVGAVGLADQPEAEAEIRGTIGRTYFYLGLPDRAEPLVFLTNQVEWGPTTIARIYKDRWQIELFFRALKQNLRVKTFVGTSPNGRHSEECDGAA